MYSKHIRTLTFEDSCQSFRVEYQTPTGYPYQVSLVSPPLLLQTRAVRTDHCAYQLGTEYNAKVWDTAANSTCSPPYHCTEEITQNATALMACSSKESPQNFFGRKPYIVGGKIAFFDFLQSIADAELVMRAGEPIPTRSFLDSQTQTISCLMVCVCVCVYTAYTHTP